MKIQFCDLCNESVPEGDLKSGKAFLRKGRVVCATCNTLMGGSEDAGSEAPAAAAPVGGHSPRATFRRAARCRW